MNNVPVDTLDADILILGAGTDGRSPLMLSLLAVLVAPNVSALAYRMLPAAPRPPQPRARGAAPHRRARAPRPRRR